jgi:RNA polymerase sigma-70 factor, ECF subfamily
MPRLRTVPVPPAVAGPQRAAAVPVPSPRSEPVPGTGSRPRPCPAPGPAAPPSAGGQRSGALPATCTGGIPAPGPRDLEQVAVWDLVRRAQAGDAEGFGLLYDRYVDIVFRFVHSRVGDRATAEDVTSETFVRALRRIDSLSFQGRDVGAWLVTIARNIVLDHVKSSRVRLEVTTADMRDADRATTGPEDAVLRDLTSAALLAGVARLSREQRECVVLRFLQGLSVAETAAAMGKKAGAIKALQHRATRRLATLLPEGLL